MSVETPPSESMELQPVQAGIIGEEPRLITRKQSLSHSIRITMCSVQARPRRAQHRFIQDIAEVGTQVIRIRKALPRIQVKCPMTETHAGWRQPHRNAALLYHRAACSLGKQQPRPAGYLLILSARRSPLPGHLPVAMIDGCLALLIQSLPHPIRSCSSTEEYDSSDCAQSPAVS